MRYFVGIVGVRQESHLGSVTRNYLQGPFTHTEAEVYAAERRGLGGEVIILVPADAGVVHAPTDTILEARAYSAMNVGPDEAL